MKEWQAIIGYMCTIFFIKYINITLISHGCAHWSPAESTETTLIISREHRYYADNRQSAQTLHWLSVESTDTTLTIDRMHWYYTDYQQKAELLAESMDTILSTGRCASPYSHFFWGSCYQVSNVRVAFSLHCSPLKVISDENMNESSNIFDILDCIFSSDVKILFWKITFWMASHLISPFGFHTYANLQITELFCHIICTKTKQRHTQGQCSWVSLLNRSARLTLSFCHFTLTPTFCFVLVLFSLIFIFLLSSPSFLLSWALTFKVPHQMKPFGCAVVPYSNSCYRKTLR